jgi:hypothetical protein
MLKTLAVGLQLQKQAPESSDAQNTLDDFILSLKEILIAYGATLEAGDSKIQFQAQELPAFKGAEDILSKTGDDVQSAWRSSAQKLAELVTTVLTKNQEVAGSTPPSLADLEQTEKTFDTQFQTYIQPGAEMIETITKVAQQKTACTEEKQRWIQEIKSLVKQKNNLLSFLNKTYFKRGTFHKKTLIAEAPAPSDASLATVNPQEEADQKALRRLILSAQTPFEKRAIATRNSLKMAKKKLNQMTLNIQPTHEKMIEILESRHQVLTTLRNEFNEAWQHADQQLKIFKDRVNNIRNPGMSLGAVVGVALSYINPLAYLPKGSSGGGNGQPSDPAAVTPAAAAPQENSSRESAPEEPLENDLPLNYPPVAETPSSEPEIGADLDTEEEEGAKRLSLPSINSSTLEKIDVLNDL